MEFDFSPCKREDVPRLTELFEAAAEFQRQNSAQQWLGFETERLEAEIEREQLWKLVDGEKIACVFLCLTEDPKIWQYSENERAIYLHRIAVSDQYRGKGCMQAIVDWARDRCTESKWDFVRIDTWAHNEKLVNYYIRFGFRFVKEVDPKDIEGLPAHYGEPLALLEMKIAR